MTQRNFIPLTQQSTFLKPETDIFTQTKNLFPSLDTGNINNISTYNKYLNKLYRPYEMPKYKVDYSSIATQGATDALALSQSFKNTQPFKFKNSKLVGEGKLFKDAGSANAAAGVAMGLGVMAGNLFGASLQKDPLNKEKMQWGKGIEGAVKGASMGAQVGSLIPGWGTAAGAAVGGVAGGVYGAIQGKKASEAATEADKEMKKFNAILGQQKIRDRDMFTSNIALGRAANAAALAVPYRKTGGLLKYTNQPEISLKEQVAVIQELMPKKKSGGLLKTPVLYFAAGGVFNAKQSAEVEQVEMLRKIVHYMDTGFSAEDVAVQLSLDPEEVGDILEQINQDPETLEQLRALNLKEANKSNPARQKLIKPRKIEFKQNPIFRRGGLMKLKKNSDSKKVTSCKTGCSCQPCSTKKFTALFKKGGEIKIDLTKENLIVDGALHSEHNNTGVLGDKGVPVVFKRGDKYIKVAEIEGEEMILTKKNAEILESLRAKVKSGVAGAKEKLGEFLYEQLNNTRDYAELM